MTPLSRLAPILLLLITACALPRGSAALLDPVPLIPVTDTTVVPFSSICHIEAVRWGDVRNSSGALIAPNVLLTAGHNVWSPIVQRVSHGVVRCGRAGESETWRAPGAFGHRDQRTAYGYVYRRFSLDYGIVYLKGAAPYAPAFRLLRPDERQPMPGDTVFVAGYPGRSTEEAPFFPGDTMHWAKGAITRLSGDRIYYSVVGARGVSGSPVWWRSGNENVIVGVHVSGSLTEARARRINARAFDEITGWIRRAPAP